MDVLCENYSYVMGRLHSLLESGEAMNDDPLGSGTLPAALRSRLKILGSTFQPASVGGRLIDSYMWEGEERTLPYINWAVPFYSSNGFTASATLIDNHRLLLTYHQLVDGNLVDEDNKLTEDLHFVYGTNSKSESGCEIHLDPGVKPLADLDICICYFDPDEVIAAEQIPISIPNQHKSDLLTQPGSPGYFCGWGALCANDFSNLNPRKNDSVFLLNCDEDLDESVDKRWKISFGTNWRQHHIFSVNIDSGPAKTDSGAGLILPHKGRLYLGGILVDHIFGDKREDGTQVHFTLFGRTSQELLGRNSSG